MRIADFRPLNEETGSSVESAIRHPPSAIRWLPALLCLLYLGVLAYLGHRHPFGAYWTETDFYQLYAPDAERLAAGQFPENPYQGPGYPAAVALVAKFTGDVFTSGKWVSIVSAVLVAWLTFLIFERLFSYRVGLGAMLIVMVSGEFPQFAINAATDAFFLMLCLAVLVVFTDTRLAARWRVALAAATTALAYLTRYNGLFLLVACLVGIIALDLFGVRVKERLGLAALFIVVFVVVTSPWLYVNYRHRGSAFYTTNYLNIATEFYPEIAGGRTNQDGTRELTEKFHSFGEVLRYDPKRMVTHYPVNLYESLQQSLMTDLVSPWVGWLGLVGLVLVAVERRSKAVLLVAISGVLYFLLMGLIHWETRYYFFVMVLYAGLAVYAVFRLLELLRARGWLAHPAFTLIPTALVVVMWVTSLAGSRKDLTHFLASHPTEVLSACDYLKQSGVSGARIMSRKPHLAYICRQEWVFFPRVKSLDELKEQLRQNHVDYLTISPVETSRRREVAGLKNPKAAPPWLKPVWVSANPPYILYKTEISPE